MAGKGPPPKQNAVRRNKAPYSHPLAAAPTAGRQLPRALGIQTQGAKRFWKTWSESPQSQHFAETDWAELEITTKLVDAFYLGEVKLAGEIRQRVTKWGATVEDRARLRMDFENPDETTPCPEAEENPPENVLAMDLYKKLSGG